MREGGASERTAGAQYEEDLAGTERFFKDLDVHALPRIFAYWGSKHLNPIWEEHGFSAPAQFFARYLLESATRAGAADPVFCSIGSGVCVVEIETAQMLRQKLERFSIHCVELSGELLERGKAAAIEAGLEDFLSYEIADLNSWAPPRRYDGVMVHHALHHVVNLEGLLDGVKGCLSPSAYFVVADMIGRNGHQRWPEALEHVHRFWRELQPRYTYNHLLKRYEELYENWDCSTVAFEGIRAQDILPLLIERFHFAFFLAFGNVIDIFIDRCFGHNFDPDQAWDRDFIDRVHAFDEAAIRAGTLTPTQMLAVLCNEPIKNPVFSRGLRPERCVRAPERGTAAAVFRQIASAVRRSWRGLAR